MKTKHSLPFLSWKWRWWDYGEHREGALGLARGKLVHTPCLLPVPFSCLWDGSSVTLSCVNSFLHLLLSIRKSTVDIKFKDTFSRGISSQCKLQVSLILLFFTDFRGTGYY